MCTLSLYRDGSSYVMTMNRDERHERGELPPKKTQINGVEVVYPVDAQAGGTWFGTNSEGVTAGLLNSYQNQKGEAKYSRGKIIPTLLSSGCFDQCLSWLTDVSLCGYDAFNLILVSQFGAAQCFWDGEHKTITKLNNSSWFFITSSSLDFERVSSLRKRYFDNWSKSGAVKDVIEQVHQWSSSDPSDGILMHRSYSKTKSVSQVVFPSNSTDVRYMPL